MWELAKIFPKFLKQADCLFMVSNIFGNALIRKKNLYVEVQGIPTSAHGRLLEVDENGKQISLT